MIPRKLMHLALARRRQWWSPDALRRHAERRLRAMVAHAAARSPLYRRTWRRAGVDPGAVRRIEDLRLLPVTEKAEVLPEAGRVAWAEGVAPARVMHTSGSGGAPLDVAVDAAAFDMWDAIYGRALFAAGYRPTDRIAYFWEPRPDGALYERLGLMRKSFVSPLLDPADQWRAVVRLRPQVIYCFPSTLLLLAREARSRPDRRVAPRVIVSHGEWLSHGVRREVERCFGCPVLDQYGAQEFNRIAWECPEHRRLHLDLDAVVAEVEVDGRPARAGEVGSLLLTGLLNRAMPLVRYRIGDFAAPDPRPCPCGRGLPVLASLEGRADSVLRRADGTPVSPRQVVPLVERNDRLSRFRLVQGRPGTLRLEVQLRDGVDRQRAGAGLEAVRRDLARVMGPGAEVTVAHRTDFDQQGRGKIHAVVARPPAEPAA